MRKKTKAELAAEEKVRADFAALQARGVAAFKEYHPGPYAQAKLEAGIVFTPELVGYLERGVANRKLAEKIRKENTADITEESDNGTAEAATDRASNGNIGAGTGGSDRPADTGRGADDVGAVAGEPDESTDPKARGRTYSAA